HAGAMAAGLLRADLRAPLASAAWAGTRRPAAGAVRRGAERSARAAPCRATRQGLSSPERVYADGMSLSTVAWPLRTARLEIRPLEDEDLDAMWEFRRLPEVNRWLGRA